MSLAEAGPARAALADEFLPTYDVSDAVAVVVDVDADATWQALQRADLIEIGRRKPLVGVLGALRALPEIVSQILHGERPPAPPQPMTLHELARVPLGEGGWSLLGERPGDEIALGLVGKFWRPVIEFVAVDAAGFAGFDEPGYAKTVYSLSVRALDGHRTRLSGLMRTATTDEHARRCSGGTGPSASAPARICSLQDCSTSYARTPKRVGTARPTGGVRWPRAPHLILATSHAPTLRATAVGRVAKY